MMRGISSFAELCTVFWQVADIHQFLKMIFLFRNGCGSFNMYWIFCHLCCSHIFSLPCGISFKMLVPHIFIHFLFSCFYLSENRPPRRENRTERPPRLDRKDNEDRPRSDRRREDRGSSSGDNRDRRDREDRPESARRGRGRGGFRGGGGGGRGRGGFDRPGKREYDRHSGSEKT